MSDSELESFWFVSAVLFAVVIESTTRQLSTSLFQQDFSMTFLYAVLIFALVSLAIDYYKSTIKEPTASHSSRKREPPWKQASSILAIISIFPFVFISEATREYYIRDKITQNEMVIYIYAALATIFFIYIIFRLGDKWKGTCKVGIILENRSHEAILIYFLIGVYSFGMSVCNHLGILPFLSQNVLTLSIIVLLAFSAYHLLWQWRIS